MSYDINNELLKYEDILYMHLYTDDYNYMFAVYCIANELAVTDHLLKLITIHACTYIYTEENGEPSYESYLCIWLFMIIFYFGTNWVIAKAQAMTAKLVHCTSKVIFINRKATKYKFSLYYIIFFNIIVLFFK